MSPTIPQIVSENNERDKKHRISDPSTLDNLIKKWEKYAIYFRTQYVKNFPQMGKNLGSYKKRYPNLRHNQNNPYISCLCQYRANFTIVKARNPYVHNFAYPYFACYSKGGGKLTVNHVPCTSIFMMSAVNDVSLFLHLFSNSFHFVCFALFLLCVNCTQSWTLLELTQVSSIFIVTLPGRLQLSFQWESSLFLIGLTNLAAYQLFGQLT